jgi:transporter family protein
MQQHSWLLYAFLAAVCAGAINVLAKIGMKDVNSDLATAVRSLVQAAFCAGFVAIIGGWTKLSALRARPLAIGMIVASGVAGGLSWIFAFRAIQLADVSKVAPIDKLSLPLGILLAVAVLGERPTLVNWVGIMLVVAGAYLATMRGA